MQYVKINKIKKDCNACRGKNPATWKATETAAHEIISMIERSLPYKQYILVAFLDIEAAFSNVRTKAIKKAIIRIGLKVYFTHKIVSMLTTRIIQSDLVDSTWPELSEEGCRRVALFPRCCGYTCMDEIAKILDRCGGRVVAYVEELVILVSWIFSSIVNEIMEGTYAYRRQGVD